MTTNTIQIISSFFKVSPVWLAGLDSVSESLTIDDVEESISHMNVQQLNRLKKYIEYIESRCSDDT